MLRHPVAALQRRLRPQGSGGLRRDDRSGFGASFLLAFVGCDERVQDAIPVLMSRDNRTARSTMFAAAPRASSDRGDPNLAVAGVPPYDNRPAGTEGRG